MRWLVVVVLLVACSAHGNPVEKKYPKSEFRVSRFEGYKIDGLTLWRVVGQSMPDRNGDQLVVGLDGRGGLVEGWPLMQRAAPGLSPSELTRRVFDLLLAGHGYPLDPATDKPWSMFPPEEWALVKAPSVADGVLTFWFVEGEMAPRVVRGTLELKSGELARRSARDVLNPPENALPGIRARLQSRDPEIVRAGLQQVSEWKELAPDVEELLRFPDGTVRMQAVGVLTNLKQPRSIAALIRMLEEGPEWGDRSLAGQALVNRYGTPEAVAAVRAHVERGGPGQEVYVLRGVLADWDKGKRN